MPRNTDKRPLPQQHKRSFRNNYHGRCIYMITLCTEGRLPLLGTLDGNSAETAVVQPSQLGQEVLRCWNNIPALQKQFAQDKSLRTGMSCQRDISLIACQLMPDHFHGILFVHNEMDVSVGDVVRGFMVGCTKVYNTLKKTTENPKPLWEKGYHDRILNEKGQLQRMVDYVRDNPRRLWIKTQHPDLFRIHRQTEVRGLAFTSLGNHFLLDWPERQLIEVSRSTSDEQLQQLLQAALVAAQNGAITYTAAISKGEQLIARTLREQGFPLVILLSNGFPTENSPTAKYYKPGGTYFEACAAGRLLLLEPAAEVYESPDVRLAVEKVLRQKAADKHLSFSYIPVTTERYRFVALNQIGRMLVED